jgi:hypothetical protein
MKIHLKFIAARVSEHVSREWPGGMSSSVRLVPLEVSDNGHDENTRRNCMALWPRGVSGDLEMGYLDPHILKTIRAGTVVGVTLDIPD